MLLISPLKNLKSYENVIFIICSFSEEIQELPLDLTIGGYFVTLNGSIFEIFHIGKHKYDRLLSRVLHNITYQCNLYIYYI